VTSTLLPYIDLLATTNMPSKTRKPLPSESA